MPKDLARLERQMAQRGWTWRQVEEAKAKGHGRPTINRETDTPATRYIHPETGRSVIIDDTTGDVIHVGGDGYVY